MRWRKAVFSHTELNSSSKSHNSKVSANDSQLTPTEGFLLVDIEGVSEILQTIFALHQESSELYSSYYT